VGTSPRPRLGRAAEDHEKVVLLLLSFEILKGTLTRKRAKELKKIRYRRSDIFKRKRADHLYLLVSNSPKRHKEYGKTLRALAGDLNFFQTSGEGGKPDAGRHLGTLDGTRSQIFYLALLLRSITLSGESPKKGKTLQTATRERLSQQKVQSNKIPNNGSKHWSTSSTQEDLLYVQKMGET